MKNCTKIRDAILAATIDPDGGAYLGLLRPALDLGGPPAAWLTVPEAIALAQQLPPVVWKDGQPCGWGLFPPKRNSQIVTLVRDFTSMDANKQDIKQGAQGWIVCLWGDQGKGRKIGVWLRIGFKRSRPELEPRWVDVRESDLATIPAIGGGPRPSANWELRDLG